MIIHSAIDYSICGKTSSNSVQVFRHGTFETISCLPELESIGPSSTKFQGKRIISSKIVTCHTSLQCSSNLVLCSLGFTPIQCHS